jgi:ketosteroid isomerase-like protein
MKRLAMLGVALAVLLTACGGSGKKSAAEQQAQHQSDLYAIDQIERTWHKAASTHNVDLMMSIWADDATFNLGTETLRGKAQIRNFWTHKAPPFKPENHWVSDTPAFKIRTTVSGDKGTLYFECHYVDVKTGKVALVVGADQNVERINGKWLITSLSAATPKLGP